MDELSYLQSLQGSGIRPGLQRVRALLRAAGRPERSCRFVIVAGTNGKGSTSATLSAILHRAGIRSALYTSPHLVRIEERWRIAEQDIATPLLIEAIGRLRIAATRSGFSPTYFEALTVIAFIAFEMAASDVAILEVGMGGRLDATNVVRPLAALISRVGIDHTEYLGTTIASIAREKAGVIHRGAIAVTSNDDPTVLRVLRSRCRRVGVELHETSREVTSEVGSSPEGPGLRLVTPTSNYQLQTPLSGAHQIENIALAVRAAELLREQVPEISQEAIEDGVRNTRWRGRLERFHIGEKVVLVDGAHNPQGAEAIARYVRESVRQPRTLVFGVMRDKDPAELASRLFPLFERIILTEPPDGRAATVAELEVIARAGGHHAELHADPEDAIDFALRSQGREVVVAGSLYLAGRAIEVLDRRIAAAAASASSKADSAQETEIHGRSLPNSNLTTL